MNNNRLRIAFAALCLLAAGLVTLYNVGAFERTTSLDASSPPNQESAPSDSPDAGVLRKEPI